MARTTLGRIAFLIALVLGVVAARAAPAPRGASPAALDGVLAGQEERGSPRAQSPLTILQINDVYTTIPIDGMGGLARIATLKKQMAAAGRTPLLVLAGDFLGASLASSVFKGEQMVAALNAAGLDYATLGNHEFDFGHDVLVQRMSEAKFQWIVSNVVDTRTGKPIGNAAPYVVRTFGNLSVGFIGLCLTTSLLTPEAKAGIGFIDPMQAAARYVPLLKRRGANVIVAITHLEFADDRELVRRFPQIDLVIGGHEHFPITGVERHALISKAGSDGKWVARIDVARSLDGPVERFYELLPITSAIPDEPRTAEVVAAYEARLGRELDTVVGSTAVPLDATGARLSGESNLGNLVADALRANVGADIGLNNAGGMRGDRVYPAGPLTRRTLLAIHPFGNLVVKVAVPGRVLLEALNNGVSKLPAGAGQFPQVSGLTMKVDARGPPGARVSDVRVGGEPLDPNKTYTVAMPDFVLKGGDGYAMFAGLRVLVNAESGDLVATALEKYITARRQVAPAIEGRITITR